MSISLRDKKLIFKYLMENPGGLHFNQILKPPPKPVKKGGGVAMESVREVGVDKDALFEYWEDLKRQGIIRSVDDLNPNFYILTEKGKRIAEQGNFDLDEPCIDLESLIKDDKLRSLVIGDFNDQRYEDAVFKAYKHLEERVRAKAGLSPSDIGTKLMVAALHHKSGKLRVPTCADQSEEEAIFLLFKGAIQLFKNPSSHRTVDWNDTVKAAQVILFADVLLGFLDQAVIR